MQRFLSKDEITQGLAILRKLGVTPRLWRALLKSDLELLGNFMEFRWPDGVLRKKKRAGILVSAEGIQEFLRLDTTTIKKPPKPRPEELVIWYGGWTIGDLVDTKFVTIHVDDGLLQERADAGYYRIIYETPGTNNQTYNEQVRHLASFDPRCKPAPLAVAVTAIMAFIKMDCDIFVDRPYRCEASTHRPRHSACIQTTEPLSFDRDRLIVFDHQKGQAKENLRMLGAIKCK